DVTGPARFRSPQSPQWPDHCDLRPPRRVRRRIIETETGRPCPAAHFSYRINLTGGALHPTPPRPCADALRRQLTEDPTMTYLFNDPADFATDAVAGLAAAHPEHVAVVHGGVVRATETPTGQPALVIGGGSGHYPAFAGWVGPGMGHGAPCGNIFSSPSASQVYAVARNAEGGGGVILGFGNYAGDVLRFGAAAEELRAEGVDVRIIKVSDDIGSNSPENHRDRRGIAGDLPVFKIAGAAIEAGADLDEAERIAWKANDATRSFGVAFDGPTLPGADEALFHVEDGQ